jgi:hypothetical protein
MKTNIEPLYFLEPADPAIERYRNIFETYTTPEHQTLALELNEEIVRNKDVDMIQKVVMALQHYPHLIHKFLFCLKFSFTMSKDSGTYVQETDWKKDPLYHQWFRKLAEIPFMLFFLQDHEVRLYALMGDIITEGNIQIDELVDRNLASMFTPQQLQVMQDRMFNACLSLLVYCQHSGFNPEIYAQGTLASFDAVFTFDDVVSEYTKDVLTDYKASPFEQAWLS